ncbi:uncharacterized protein K452DRAFT_308444 [Aplosporella prunicola CBS 121167]|uniref:MARVEL domain-containing protein n=1 Tax=Aplosporella prunicola CBS 121167 TaxID=1176127 RepID=A0A6A6BGQ6_9PEZI|nr:uncharacterized protein K452DRAFT_308444 [Aplosporella prunicola CBS 121167]KAF2142047.1 hypothetical protein K452DRAFT_308444 [Aplosporella prunicola CBS 121167]
MTLARIVMRSVQIVFSAVVLGLSIKLIQDQVFGTSRTINVAAFSGAFGIFAALVGLASLWLTAMSPTVLSAVDGLATGFQLAVGITIAVKLRHITCASNSDMNRYRLYRNDLTNGGCISQKNGVYCGHGNDWGYFHERCRMSSADSAFLIMAGAVFVLQSVLTYIHFRRAARDHRGGTFV